MRRSPQTLLAQVGTDAAFARSMKVNSLLDAVLADYRVSDRRSTYFVRYRVERHLRVLLGEHEAEALTTADLLRYADTRRGQGASGATINLEIAVVRRGFKLSGLWPEWQRLAWRRLRQSPPRTSFFTDDEFERLIECARVPWLEPPLRFARITGWRLASEVAPLTWDRVDLGPRGRVWLERGTTKNGEPRSFPLTTALRALLEKQRAETPRSCRWVFHRRGRQLKSIRTAFENARKRAGLEHRIIHDLRRTAARTMIRSGIQEQVAMALGGWLDRDVFSRYNVTDDADLRSAVRLLDQHAAAQRRGGSQ